MAQKERIFNYRICRARRVVENVFGLASSVFRVLRKLTLLEPEKPQPVVMTNACLHNFLRSRDSAAFYTSSGTLNFKENGRVIERSWSAMNNENITSLFPIRKICVNQV